MKEETESLFDAAQAGAGALNVVVQATADGVPAISPEQAAKLAALALGFAYSRDTAELFDLAMTKPEEARKIMDSILIELAEASAARQLTRNEGEKAAALDVLRQSGHIN